ncbi:MAG: hypothetical protein ACFE89_11890 [Candidatus Hodarchaeota archaeon]
MARWIKKSLTFPLTRASAQIAFVDQLKRKLKLDFLLNADQRGITVTLRGDPEQVRLAVHRAVTIFREFKEEIPLS